MKEKTRTEKQTQAEKDGWHRLEPRTPSPCDGCEMGFGSYSCQEIDGILYTKTEDCHDTCERFKNWKPTKRQIFKRVI